MLRFISLRERQHWQIPKQGYHLLCPSNWWTSWIQGESLYLDSDGGGMPDTWEIVWTESFDRLMQGGLRNRAAVISKEKYIVEFDTKEESDWTDLRIFLPRNTLSKRKGLFYCLPGCLWSNDLSKDWIIIENNVCVMNHKTSLTFRIGQA